MPPPSRRCRTRTPGPAQALMASPNGSRYTLAIECSKPAATNAAIGGTITTTLSVVLRAPNDIHTARQTSTLQSTREKEQLNGRQRRLGGGDGERGLADGAVGKAILPGQQHQRRRTQCAGDVSRIDQRPGTQQRAERDPPAGVGHDHQRVPGEQFGAADDHQDQSERKRQPSQQPSHAPRQVSGAGHHNGREHRAERNESTGQDTQHDQGDRVTSRLDGSRRLAGACHIGRQQSVDAPGAGRWRRSFGQDKLRSG